MLKRKITEILAALILALASVGVKKGTVQPQPRSSTMLTRPTTNAIVATGVLLVALSSAAAPQTVRECGFNVARAGGAAVAGATTGMIADCALLGCIPIFTTIGAIVGFFAADEIDTNCAGTVYEGKTKNGAIRYCWIKNRNSLSSARSELADHCRGLGWTGCREIIPFRYAVAGYRAVGEKTTAYWAQAGDRPTAAEISRARCEGATGKKCKLVVQLENSN